MQDLPKAGATGTLSREENPSFATGARVAEALGVKLHFRPIKMRRTGNLIQIYSDPETFDARLAAGTP